MFSLTSISYMGFSSNAQNFNLAKFVHYKGISSFLSQRQIIKRGKYFPSKNLGAGLDDTKISWQERKKSLHRNFWHRPLPWQLFHIYEINLMKGKNCCWIRQSLGLFFCRKVAAGRPFYCMAFIIHATGLTFFTASCSLLRLPQVCSGWTRYLTSTPQWVRSNPSVGVDLLNGPPEWRSHSLRVVAPCPSTQGTPRQPTSSNGTHTPRETSNRGGDESENQRFGCKSRFQSFLYLFSSSLFLQRLPRPSFCQQLSPLPGI